MALVVLVAAAIGVPSAVQAAADESGTSLRPFRGRAPESWARRAFGNLVYFTKRREAAGAKARDFVFTNYAKR